MSDVVDELLVERVKAYAYITIVSSLLSFFFIYRIKTIKCQALQKSSRKANEDWHKVCSTRGMIFDPRRHPKEVLLKFLAGAEEQACGFVF